MQARQRLITVALVGGVASVWAALAPQPEAAGLAIFKSAVPLVALAAVVISAWSGLTSCDRSFRRLANVLDLEDGEPISPQLPPTAGDQEQRLAATVDRRLREAWAASDDLERERRLLSTILDEMKVALLLIGPDLKIQRANSNARAVFEANGSLRGVRLSSLVRDPTVLAAVESVNATGPAHAIVSWKQPESDRQYEAQLTRVGGKPESNDPPGCMALLYEITRLERLEAVRRDFVANVSHELRTPLTSIQAAIETLAAKTLKEDQIDHFFKIIERQSHRMSALVEDLTDLSQIETGSIELTLTGIDAWRVAQDVVDQLRPLAERLDVRVINDLPQPYRISADRRRLEQMLTNLVHNAIKFNRPEGSVTLTGSTNERHVTIGVEDTGTGIPFDAQERIFNRFFQVEQARSREIGGTGLGLAIVKHLMRLHGGRVRLDSELGRGSTFALDFPVGPVALSSADDLDIEADVDIAFKAL